MFIFCWAYWDIIVHKKTLGICSSVVIVLGGPLRSVKTAQILKPISGLSDTEVRRTHTCDCQLDQIPFKSSGLVWIRVGQRLVTQAFQFCELPVDIDMRALRDSTTNGSMGTKVFQNLHLAMWFDVATEVARTWCLFWSGWSITLLDRWGG